MAVIGRGTTTIASATSSDPLASAPLTLGDWEDVHSIGGLGIGNAFASTAQAGDGLLLEAAASASAKHALRHAGALPAGDAIVAARVALYGKDTGVSGFYSGRLGLDGGIGIAPGGMANPATVTADWLVLQGAYSPTSNAVRNYNATSMASLGTAGYSLTLPNLHIADLAIERTGTTAVFYYLNGGARVRIAERTVSSAAGDVLLRVTTASQAPAGRICHVLGFRVGGMGWNGGELVLST